MKTTFGPQRILFPSPVALVVTGDMDNANIVTIAWVSLLTSVPPSLGISVGTKGVSGEAIKKNKEFTVNIASVDIMTEADYCGISSGRDIDKFAETGLTKMPSKVVKAPIIRECPLNLECRLVSATMVGRTNHFIGEILETHIDTDKLKDPEKFGSVDISMFNPLIYIGGAREYRRIGEKVGDAYSIGKKINR
jgi:flavin reductase (DIM6/NTAB) family NADH-FMN oxidoreductase RutF